MPPLTIEFQSDCLIIRNEKNIEIDRREIDQSLSIRPVVKWAGGKRWLARAAKQISPDTFNSYYEPFLGGGALFFALQPSDAILSDSNRELISTYRVLGRDPERVIQLLKNYPYKKDFYYRLRGRKPPSLYSAAARFLYLNRTCWNGLYRVNKKGKFNTPFGKYKNPTICDSETLISASHFFSNARLRTGDFEKILRKTKKGDFVYLDPPYITGHQNNGFLSYNAKLFSWSDQERLAKWAVKLSESGVHVLVSIADQPVVVNLYKKFMYYQLFRRSLIGGQVESRGLITEALLANYPLMGYKSEVVHAQS